MTAPGARQEFLSEFRLRNRGLIADSDQTALSEARFLIAGCGSTGGAAIEPLVRAGAMRMILVEPGRYELHNLNRQRATLEAIGHNKATWLATYARKINPYLELEVDEAGISPQNAEGLTARADLIIDAIDVTSMDGLMAKCSLHEAAAAARRPVISAYDLAYRQYVSICDYRRLRAPLRGEIDRIRKVQTPTQALARLIPLRAIPYELLEEIERLQDEPNASISQLGCTADLFGALVVPLAVELLANRRVKQSYVLDLKDPSLPFSRRAVRSVKTVFGLVRLRARMFRRAT
ncbi:MAG: ThiF family adenylyltransferase [Gemmatimonadota bacterium]|nr:ThiF family adenylyltransferase [Gemmatimonadota bacterium]